MISPATYYRIQYEFHEEHRKFRDIARRLGLANQTVSKWASRPAYTRRTTCRQSKLDSFKPIIAKMLLEEGLSLSRIHKSLQAQGYVGGYSILKDFAKRNQPRLPVSRKEYAAHQWLHNVMQGYFPAPDLQKAACWQA